MLRTHNWFHRETQALMNVIFRSRNYKAWKYAIIVNLLCESFVKPETFWISYVLCSIVARQALDKKSGLQLWWAPQKIDLSVFSFFAFSHSKEFQSERTKMHKHEKEPAAIAFCRNAIFGLRDQFDFGFYWDWKSRDFAGVKNHVNEIDRNCFNRK